MEGMSDATGDRKDALSDPEPGSDEPRHPWAYPRPRRHGVRRWLPSWRLGSVAGVVVVCLVVVVGAVGYASVEIPAFNAEINHQTTSVYFADPADPAGRGEKMGDYPGVRREIVDCGEIPRHVKEAVVASEDRGFYSSGDVRGVARALFNAEDRNPTLTRQYVDNFYSTSGSGYFGRLSDAVVTAKVSREQSKDTILCNYLNVVYWGRGQTHGIQAAAQAYFAKDAKDLTVTQAALLAGIIPSPVNWDPANNPEKAEQRWERTVTTMVEDKDFPLTAAQKDELVFPSMCQPGGTPGAGDCVIAFQPESVYEGPNGYLMEMAGQEAADLVGVPRADFTRGGYTVITTVDQRMQDMAVASGNGLLDGTLNANPGSTPSQCDPNVEPAGAEPACAGMLHVAMVTLDPSDGSIRALYSGPDYAKDQDNRVTRGVVQAGSTFKPFTLVAALENGVSPDSAARTGRSSISTTAATATST